MKKIMQKFMKKSMKKNQEETLTTMAPATRYFKLVPGSDWWRTCPEQHPWALAMDSIAHLELPTSSTSSDSDSQEEGEDFLLLDAYVDRTFTRTEPVQQPYTQPWLGIVHHTFDTTFSTANCVNLFQNENFQASLQHCRGLIAFSSSLASQLRAALAVSPAPGAGAVRVSVLMHPTRTPNKTFDYGALLRNPTPYLVQIGSWMRNMRAICDLTIRAPNTLHLSKAVLQPSHVSGAEHASGGYCQERALSSSDASNANVTLIPTLDQDAYDDLLAHNVVFLNLVDASAVNTVLECIVRNTPVLVNRLPALVEVLGPNYPGFYDTLEGASRQLATFRALRPMPFAMHVHLTRIDKAPLALSAFAAGFAGVLMSSFEFE